MCCSKRDRGTWFVALSVLFCIAGTANAYLTDNLFVVSIDGVRDHEAFDYEFAPGEIEHPYLPFIWNELKPQGTTYMEMYNICTTYTSPGHAAILSGTWQVFPNYKTEDDSYQTKSWAPTIFEYARKELGLDASDTWCVVGKENCVENNVSIHPGYGDAFGANLVRFPTEPVPDVDGATVDKLMEILDADQPSLVFVNLEQVDHAGHTEDYQYYLDSILLADQAVERIWDRISSDPAYAGKTTMLLTTDHGRHDDEFGGFAHHGGLCHGCKHIPALWVGPDTPADVEITRTTYQIDMAPTIGELFGFATPYARGQVLREAITGYDDPDLLIMKDPDGAAYNGMAFMVWADNRSGIDQVYCKYSDDGGSTWGDIIQVSNSSVAAIQPAIAAHETGIHVVWLDYRADRWEVYYRRSEDYGDTWEAEEMLFSSIGEGQAHETAVVWEPYIWTAKNTALISVSALPYSIGAKSSLDGGRTWQLDLIDEGGYFARGPDGCRLGRLGGITWADQATDYYGVRNWEVHFKRSERDGRNWNLERRISYNEGYSIQPSISSDTKRSAGIAWADNDSDVFQILFTLSNNRGWSWYPTVEVSDSPVGAWEPSLAWDPDAREIQMVWVDFRDGHGELYGSTYTNGQWSTPSRITYSDGAASTPDLVVGNDGTTLLVWEEVSVTGTQIVQGPLVP